jgi:enoyl-CoA hydratase
MHRVVVLAEVFNPNSAVGTGLLDEVVAAEDLLDAARMKAGELMSLNHSAFAATKLRTREAVLPALRQAMDTDDAELANTPLTADR